jgi:hypothetical protein
MFFIFSRYVLTWWWIASGATESNKKLCKCIHIIRPINYRGQTSSLFHNKKYLYSNLQHLDFLLLPYRNMVSSNYISLYAPRHENCPLYAFKIVEKSDTFCNGEHTPSYIHNIGYCKLSISFQLFQIFSCNLIEIY